jgi:hypothetical protein
VRSKVHPVFHSTPLRDSLKRFLILRWEVIPFLILHH